MGKDVMKEFIDRMKVNLEEFDPQIEPVVPWSRIKRDFRRALKYIEQLQAELKARDLTIELIKNYAAIDFDDNLLATIAEIEKDPKGFEQALKGGE